MVHSVLEKSLKCSNFVLKNQDHRNYLKKSLNCKLPFFKIVYWHWVVFWRCCYFWRLVFCVSQECPLTQLCFPPRSLNRVHCLLFYFLLSLLSGRNVRCRIACCCWWLRWLCAAHSSQIRKKNGRTDARPLHYAFY